MVKYCFLVVLLLLYKPAVFGQCNTALNLALSHPAVSSSDESAGLSASNAFDGNTTTTRWSSQASDPQFIYVDLGAVYPLCQVTLFWEAAYGKDFTIDISNDVSTWTNVATIVGNTSTNNTITISGSGRYVRMYGTMRGTPFGYSLYEFQVYGTNPSPPTCPSTNIALNQPAIASSVESVAFPVSNVFDGNGGSRWSSAFSDPQYVYVDLGAVYNLCNVTLNWEAAYASSFNIDVSNDATAWTTQSSISGNTSQNNTIPLAASGRYVRMYGLTRSTPFGYSLFEFQVNGSAAALPVILSYFGAQEQPGNKVMINWTTEMELNNNYFNIERSQDGNLFQTISTIKAVGNSSVTKHYSAMDFSFLQGINYYRLKQVDLDGKFSYSKIVQVSINTENVNSISLSPNPVVNTFTVKSSQQDAILKVSIYSSAGKQLLTILNTKKDRLLLVSMTPVPHGLYFVQVQTQKNIQTFKVIK